MENKKTEAYSIENLPKRPQLSKNMSSIKTESISTNYYSLSKLENHIIYQYDITFDPPLPEDSRAIFKGCVASATS